MATVRQLHSLWIAALIGAGVSACSSDSTSNDIVRRVDAGRTDASNRPDATSDPDMGTEVDSGMTTPDMGFAVDTGPRDTGMLDTGTPDSGVVTPDTGIVTPDTGIVTPDTGIVTPDTGVVTPDTGVIRDAQPTDRGPTDTLPGDSGRRDAGIVIGDGGMDMGVRDTGIRDIGPTDTGPRDLGVRDTGPGDTGIGRDATPTDARPDAAVAPDAGAPVAECAAPIDLNMMGTMMGSALHYTGSNTAAPATPGIPGPTACMRVNYVGREVVFRYTPRATALLRVSTNYTATTFDTVAWMLNACAASGTTELGCNDDSGAPPHTAASTFTTATERAAGTPVYIIVAGYADPTTPAATGTFDLGVTEVRRVAAGGTCDVTGETTVCATGTSCGSRGGAPATCNPDGSEAGRCRPTAMPCDTGLGCGAAMRCVPQVAAGAMCDPARLTSVCTPPGMCTTTAGMSTCSTVFPYTEGPSTATFVDACGPGTHVVVEPNRDDGVATVATMIPFAFNFFGAPQTAIWPTTNGWAQFGATQPPDSLFDGVLGMTADTAVIAPFWTDLVLRDPAPASDICYTTVGTAPNRRLVIEWLDALAFSHMTTHLTFEVILSETTNTIDLVYSVLDPTTGPEAEFANGTHASIGIQQSRTSFLRHMGTVSTTASLRYTPR